MCDDCQAYAEFLGRAAEILDAHGGTDLSYATQSRFEILTGRDQLRGVRLFAAGILRVYTECCRTPVAHVPSTKMAFVGIPHLFMRGGAAGVTRDDLLGPLVLHLQGRYCRGEMPSGAHTGTPAGPWAKAMVQVVGDSLRGRQWPSAFHDQASHEPTMPVSVLSEAARERFRGRGRVGLDLSLQRGLSRGCS